MSREVETEQEIRLELYRSLIAAVVVDHLEGEARLIALAAIAQGRRARGGLAAGRGRTSPRAAIGPKGARAVTKLEERLSTPIDADPRGLMAAKSARKSTVKRKETPEQKAAKTAVRTTKAAAAKAAFR